MTDESLRTIHKSSDLVIQINNNINKELTLEFHARDPITGIMEPVLIVQVEDKDELYSLSKRILRNVERIL